ncbi:MAG: hypothetical protein LQ340_001105 [Diploschistes diacapsis]|nr:MAG: hypothetical protein LQ340_001105 [Diploschistes diacapsis]
MPSSRRVKILSLTVALIILSVLYLSSSARQSNRQFYDRTVAAMEKASQAHTDPGLPLDANQRPLAGLDLPTPDPEALTGKTEAQVPVDAGQREPVPEVKSPPEAVSNTEEAKDKAKGGKPGDVGRKWGAGIEGAEGRAKKEVDEKSEKEIKVEAELNSILKRSPIIIFSKSYCPYSKKAKAVFSKYSITPAPFIVELDQHELGSGLQAALGKTTKRRTVPNILVGGMSIGGGDEVAAMDEKRELEGKIKELGGKRIMEVKRSG